MLLKLSCCQFKLDLYLLRMLIVLLNINPKTINTNIERKWGGNKNGTREKPFKYTKCFNGQIEEMKIYMRHKENKYQMIEVITITRIKTPLNGLKGRDRQNGYKKKMT